MSADPFLSDATVTRIRDLALRGFATRALLQGRTTIRLGRWNAATEKYDAIAPQAVVVTLANRAPQQSRVESAAASTIDGYLEKETPFDVRPGDLFALGVAGQEQPAEIIYVEPEKLGTQRAAYRLRLAEAR
jgi:hypothetical protein